MTAIQRGAQAPRTASAPKQCGTCTLCCKVMPVEQLHKPMGKWCTHANPGKGCAIYDNRPTSCQSWRCLWLDDVENHTGLERPDKARYVVDIGMSVAQVDGKELAVWQVWCDYGYPSAWRDPALRRFMASAASDHGAGTLIRHSPDRGTLVLPPAISKSKQWEEHTSTCNPDYKPDIYDALIDLYGDQLIIKKGKDHANTSGSGEDQRPPQAQD